MYYLVSYQDNKNKMASYKYRQLADIEFKKLGNFPRVLISGETGDILASQGDQNMRDQCLGMFLTQRYQGKYYGKS